MDSYVRHSLLEGNILFVQLGSPDNFPRLTRRVLGELHSIFECASGTARPRAVVITGSEQAFAAGADLEEVSELDSREALRFSALGQGLMNRVEKCPVTVIAAIRGHCLGGGFDLALACHVRIAGRDATLGHPGGALGLITGWGGTARLPRLVGAARAAELLTTGRTITAEAALAWRLVSRVVEPDRVVPAAIELAASLPER